MKHKAEVFPWLEKRITPKRRDAALSARTDELKARAKLLARLHYTKQQAETRLRQNLAWEYEKVGTPVAAKKIASALSEAYDAESKRTQAPGKKK